MKSLEFLAVDAALASAVCGCCGSLAHPSPYYRGPYRDLISDLLGKDIAAALAHAGRIVAESAPEGVGPDPRRATIAEDGTGLRIATLGGVIVRFRESRGQIDLRVDFGRDSRHLASRMLAAAFLAHTSCPVSVDDEARDRDVKLALIRSLTDLV